jgi:hypothetical protein
MLETPKGYSNVWDDQQETKVIFIKLQVGSSETTRESRYNGKI